MHKLATKEKSTDGAAPVRDMRDRTVLALPISDALMPAVPASRGDGDAGAGEVAGGVK